MSDAGRGDVQPLRGLKARDSWFNHLKTVVTNMHVNRYICLQGVRDALVEQESVRGTRSGLHVSDVGEEHNFPLPNPMRLAPSTNSSSIGETRVIRP